MAFCSRGGVVLLLMYLFWFSIANASSYQEYKITNPKVCSITEKKGKIKLTEANDAAIVEETRTFDKWPGDTVFHCQFEVKNIRGDESGKVFAVIQNLRFREDEDECLDYVEFKNKSQRSGKICGDVNPAMSQPLSSEESDEADEIAMYAFIGTEEIDVTIHVAPRKLLAGEHLDLKIAFTSARLCYDIHGRNPFLSKAQPPGVPCGDGKFCISSTYANDTIVNCPFTLCRDEGGCTGYTGPSFHRPNVGTRMTIGAITTVMASFLLFFACIWVLRHYRKLCWSSDFSGQREVRMTPVPPLPSGPDSLEAGAARPVLSQDNIPTAPPLDSPVNTILPDKDLPPPYESLFPPTSR